MSIKDDLLRNRKIFELLTKQKSDAEELADIKGRRAIAPRIAEAENESSPFKPFEPITQSVEVYSLEHGKARSRENVTAISFTPLKDVEFPKLSQAEDAKIQADPIESLYHRLEVEARRSSQLSREEEF